MHTAPHQYPTRRHAGLAAAATLAVAGALLAPTLPTLPTAPAAAAAAESAGARGPTPPGTLVYVRDGDVWAADGAGGRQHAVTTDGGGKGGVYFSPTMADDGTIAAGRGRSIVRMDRSGRVLNVMTPGPIGEPGYPPTDGPLRKVAISPDGSLIAYSYSSYTCPTGSACYGRAVTAYTAAGRLTGPARYGMNELGEPSWVTGSRTLESEGGYGHQVNLHDLGTQGATHWFDASRIENAFHNAELSPDGSMVATIYEETHGLEATDWSIVWLRTSGDPRTEADPAVPTGLCRVDRSAWIDDPSWSPDSSTLVFADGGHLFTVDARCVSDERQVVADGSQPDWSAAPFREPAQQPLDMVRAPALDGRVAVGRQVALDPGRWTPSPTSVRVRWLRDGRPIAGASGTRYRPVRADRGRRLSASVTLARRGWTSVTRRTAAERVR